MTGPAITGERWDDPPRSAVASGGAPVLAVDGFEGPLDWLLELVRTQRIDLRQLSIAQLIDAFGQALAAALAAPGRADLSRWGEFLAMAALLALLRSRLLLPPDSVEAQTARRDAEALGRQLLNRDALRRAAAWLDERPQLGRDAFGRGAAAGPGATVRMTAIADLLVACLLVLRVPEQAARYAVPPPPFWRVPDALMHIRRQLANGVQGELSLFLPAIRPEAPVRALQCRAALASTFLASLELCRNGTVRLTQTGQDVRVEPAHARTAQATPGSN